MQAGHSVRVRPNPFPNLEVKPDVAVVLLRCESSWEATVLAFHSILNMHACLSCKRTVIDFLLRRQHEFLACTRGASGNLFRDVLDLADFLLSGVPAVSCIASHPHKNSPILLGRCTGFGILLWHVLKTAWLCTFIQNCPLCGFLLVAGHARGCKNRYKTL